MTKVVRIANSSGYWGDDPEALLHQVVDGQVDYVTADYLAEITMVILERQRRGDPARGFAYDFVRHLGLALPEIAKRGIRIVANAGGVNPEACRAAVEELCRKAGVTMKIAVVEGDAITDRLRELRERGVSLSHMDSGAPFDPVAERMVSAHAYLGARPVAKALDLGAQIVITGRTTDAAVVLGPMIHEFGWAEDDWDRLAAGIVAGHLIECGAQVCGGNFTDFEDVPLASERGHFGYPIAEVEASGDFTLTKHPGTAGFIDPRTVTEQLLYEIGDPRAYLTPDVSADFTSVTIVEDGPDRVRVSGSRGRPAPTTLKVSAVHLDGFKATGMMLLSGPRIRDKARYIETLLWDRVGRDFLEARADLIGFDGCWLGAAPRVEPNEGVLRIGVRDPDRKKLQRFANTVMGFGLQGPPGLGMMGGRPVVQEAFAFWPTRVPRDAITATVVLHDGERTEKAEVPMALAAARDEPTGEAATPVAPARWSGATERLPLHRIAHARSGDKGDHANIGVIGRSPEAFAFLRGALTAERVGEYYRDLCKGQVDRYELPNVNALNFVLHEALGGGGTLSLRVDHQGKTFAQGLLLMEMDVPETVLATLPPRGARS